MGTANKFGGGRGVGNNTNYNQKPTTTAFSDDYTHCGICNRRYNENAYSKHLPTCERRAKEAIIKPNINTKGKLGTTTGSTMTGTYGNNKPNLNVKFNKK